MPTLEHYWNSLPIGKENAASYDTLCEKWKVSKRQARSILHDLSLYDGGDDYILIRSSSGKGFYRTDDMKIIRAFREECVKKAKSNFAPLKKINRILTEAESTQTNFVNNLKNMRVAKGLKQTDVIKQLQRSGVQIDAALLSKFENSVCLPTPYQLCLFARIYGCSTRDLVNTELLYLIG